MKQVMAVPIGPALRLQVDAHEGWQCFVHGCAVYLDGTSYLARDQRPLPALWFFFFSPLPLNRSRQSQ